MRRSLLLFSSCLVVALLAGCGSKGPLVLPPSKAVPATSTTAPPPASAASSGLPVESQP